MTLDNEALARTSENLGFIGLGVMGEPMCRNLATKSGRTVLGFDSSKEPLERLTHFGVSDGSSLTEMAQSCDVLFLALPSGKHVKQVCLESGGLLAGVRPDTIVVDLGTSPVDLTRELAARFSEVGARFVDAPIARTRQAAEAGTLSIMVGSDEKSYAQLLPLLGAIASDVTHCGPTGSGQIVKILNNMVLIETVVALSEAMAVARRAGLDGRILFETLSKGSADSFALRNHGMKSILEGHFPERAFSTDYALKDLSYAVALSTEVGVELRGAQLATELLETATAAGFGSRYWPVLSRVIEASGFESANAET